LARYNPGNNAFIRLISSLLYKTIITHLQLPQLVTTRNIRWVNICDRRIERVINSWSYQLNWNYKVHYNLLASQFQQYIINLYLFLISVLNILLYWVHFSNYSFFPSLGLLYLYIVLQYIAWWKCVFKFYSCGGWISIDCLSMFIHYWKYKIYTWRRPHSSLKSTASRVCQKKKDNNNNIVRFCIE